MRNLDGRGAPRAAVNENRIGLRQMKV